MRHGVIVTAPNLAKRRHTILGEESNSHSTCDNSIFAIAPAATRFSRDEQRTQQPACYCDEDSGGTHC